MAIKKRDWIFIGIVATVFGVFFAISGEIKTKRVPYDDIHQKFHEVKRQEGKKAAEKFCGQCHGVATEAPFPDNGDHRPNARCLFCHKLATPN